MWMHAYNETRNLIEIRGRGVKIIKLLLDHNLSYEDNTYYERKKRKQKLYNVSGYTSEIYIRFLNFYEVKKD